MNNSRRPRLLLILLAIAIGGVGMTSAVWIARSIQDADRDWQLTALIKWGNPPAPTPEWVDMVAQYDFAAFSWGVWDTPAMRQAATDIRRQNIDIHLGTYFSAFSVPRWTRADAERGGTGWGAKWWNALSPFMAYTPQGDTASIFADQQDFNVLNPEARAAACGLLHDYVAATGITWAMLDFVSVPLQSFHIPGYPVREPDFDGNGIACKDDPAEQALLKAAFMDYARELRAAVPSGFLLIPNGALAMTDRAYSRLVDGCYVEGFPKWFYGSGDTPNYVNALDPSFGPQAVPQLCDAGRWASINGYVMIEAPSSRSPVGDIAALWPGCVELVRSTNDLSYPIPPISRLSWGAPTGEASYANGTWSRQFQDHLLSVGGKVDLR